MCLIIAPGKDGKPALLPRDVFDYAYTRNNDGFGAMWVEDGRVQHFKTLGLTADEIYSQMEERVERNPDIIFHMRLKTHGKVISNLSHPFRILKKSRHGKDLFFMHNGVLGNYGNKLSYGQSDTTVFKDEILVPLLTRDPDALEDPEVLAFLNKLTSGSRLVFLDSDGKSYFTSPAGWNARYGLQLSNTYMLPPEASFGFNRSSPKSAATQYYTLFRTIDKAGIVADYWCNCPKKGYVRTESGNLYRDNGTGKTIYHAADYIEKDQEFRHLGLSLVPYNGNGDDNFDDDVPEFQIVPRKDTGPAPLDERLRYARLVHNTYGGAVTSRAHLVADLIGMGTEELPKFVSEDPETSSVIFAELIEMVLEYNDTLWRIDPNHPKILSVDEVLRIGQADYHKEAMLEISKARRIQYEQQLDQLFGDEEIEDDQKVSVN